MPIDVVPDSLDEVIVESQEGGFTDGNGEFNHIIPESDVGSSDSIDLSFDEVVSADIESNVISFLAVGDYDVDLSSYSNRYTVSVSGSKYTLLLPEGATVEVFDDYLVNTGSSSVSGLLFDGETADLSSYHDMMLTLQPFLSTSANTNAYRYGSWSYVTTYSPGTNNNLVSNQTYVQVEVLDKPKAFYDFTQPELLACGLLFLSVVLSVVKGVFGK